MHIRPATLGDMPRIIAINRVLFAEHAVWQPEYWVAAARDEQSLQEIVAGENSGIFVAEENGEVAGMAMYAERETLPRPCAIPHRYVHLMDTVVAPGYRSRGIGAALIAKVEAWARQRGVDYVELNVVEENEGARRLYERIGFRPVTRTMRRTL